MAKEGTRATRADHGKGIQASSVAPHDTRPTLSDLRITRDQSAKWQSLAKLPREQFEERAADADCCLIGDRARARKN